MVGEHEKAPFVSSELAKAARKPMKQAAPSIQAANSQAIGQQATTPMQPAAALTVTVA
jgi:hypothetical protein